MIERRGANNRSAAGKITGKIKGGARCSDAESLHRAPKGTPDASRTVRPKDFPIHAVPNPKILHHRNGPPEGLPLPAAPGPKTLCRVEPFRPKASRSPRRRTRRSFAVLGHSALRFPDPHGAGPEDPLPCRTAPPEGFAIPATPDPKILCRARPFRPKASRSPRRRTRRSFAVLGRSARRLPNPHGAGPEGPLPCRTAPPEGFAIPAAPDPKILRRAGPFRPKASQPTRRRARRPFTVSTSPPEGFPIHTTPGPKTHCHAAISVRSREVPRKRKKAPNRNFLWIKAPIPVDNLVNPGSALFAPARVPKGDPREAKTMASNAARQPPRPGRLDTCSAGPGLRESPPRP